MSSGYWVCSECGCTFHHAPIITDYGQKNTCDTCYGELQKAKVVDAVSTKGINEDALLQRAYRHAGGAASLFNAWVQELGGVQHSIQYLKDYCPSEYGLAYLEETGERRNGK